MDQGRLDKICHGPKLRETTGIESQGMGDGNLFNPFSFRDFYGFHDVHGCLDFMISMAWNGPCFAASWIIAALLCAAFLAGLIGRKRPESARQYNSQCSAHLVLEVHGEH